MLYNDFFPLSHGKPMELANFKNIHVYLSHTISVNSKKKRSVNSSPRKIKHTYCSNWGMYCFTNFCEKFLSLGIVLLAVLSLPLDYSMLLNHWTFVHWDKGVMVTWIMIKCYYSHLFLSRRSNERCQKIFHLWNLFPVVSIEFSYGSEAATLVSTSPVTETRTV